MRMCTKLTPLQRYQVMIDLSLLALMSAAAGLPLGWSHWCFSSRTLCVLLGLAYLELGMIEFNGPSGIKYGVVCVKIFTRYF